MQVACLEGLAKGLAAAKSKTIDKEIFPALEKNLPEQNDTIREAIKKIKVAAGETP